MIDTHTHIYLNAFDNDRHAMLQRAKDAGVKKCYLPAIDSQTHTAMLELEDHDPAFCKAMMGLHPCYVGENPDQELKKVEDWLTKRKFAAIGECGLDYYWDKSFIDQQKEALRIQINWSIQHQLPIVLHTREATQDSIDLVAKHGKPELTGIFHCFGGTREEAEQIVALGFKLGIGGVVTYKKAGLDAVLQHIDLQYIVLETDAPYLAPIPHRGKRNEPAFLVHVVQQLAEIYGITEKEVIDQTTQTALTLFKEL
jgi:TatD DNase family protein